jgi:molecular chaperone DnaK
VEVKNQADTLVYNTEKLVKENREKLEESDIKAAEDAIKDTKAAMESGDVNQIKEKMEVLTKASHHLAEVMYKQTQSQQQQTQPPPGDGGGAQAEKDEDVVDAEFEDAEKK